jgi:hypothetical protein
MRNIQCIKSLFSHAKQPFAAVKETHNNIVVSAIPFNFAGVDDVINDIHHSKITKFLH